MGNINSKKKVIRFYIEKQWSMSKLGRKSEFSRHKVRDILVKNDVEIRSQKEQCNTDNFREKLREANKGKELSEEHKEAISKGINSSEKFDEAMKVTAKEREKNISDEKIIELYNKHGENAEKVSKFVDLSGGAILNRLNRNGIDTSKDEPWNKGREWSDEVKEKMSKAKKGKTWEEIFGEENAQWRKNNIGEKISKSKKGYSRSKETKRKLRLARIREVEKRKNNGNQIHPAYNPEACKIIEEYGDKNGYDFQHAENGGEFFVEGLGYWVDGYDEEKNVVVEFDEKTHFRNGSLKEKDEERMEEIIDYLDCTFIRINHNKKVYIKRNN